MAVVFIGTAKNWFSLSLSFQPYKVPPTLKGIGINCTKPHFISKFGIAAKSILPDLTLIVYPNSGEEWHTNKSDHWSGKDGEWVGERRDIIHYIQEWKEIGFQWFGGCCRVTPNEITAIRKAVFDK